MGARGTGDAEHAAVKVGEGSMLGTIAASEAFLVVAEVVAVAGFPPLAVGAVVDITKRPA